MGIVAKVPTVSKCVVNARIDRCGTKGDGFAFFDGSGFSNRGDRGGDVIDFDAGGLVGDCAVFIGDAQNHVIGAVIDKCVVDILTDYWIGVIAEVPAIGEGVEDTRVGSGGTKLS